jgi:hypothetical protein
MKLWYLHRYPTSVLVVTMATAQLSIPWSVQSRTRDYLQPSNKQPVGVACSRDKGSSHVENNAENNRLCNALVVTLWEKSEHAVVFNVSFI